MMNREAKQRRITGKVERPYQWMDRPERRPTRRPPQSVRHYAPEPPRESREDQYKRYVGYLNRAVMYGTLIIVVLVLFMEIGKLSEISSQRKRINAIYEENKTLTAEIEGLEVQLCMETRPSIIKQKASTIGMVTPAENEVCVLRTVVRRTTDTAQTAESGTRAR
ncbi:MAG: hypothetical protein Q4E18_13270 [Clostridia bacterium]|nr:hypothetical protein [Clostridia bacterium]